MRLKTDCGINEIYRYYRKNSSNPVAKSKFVSVFKKFAEAVTDEIVYGNFDFHMPFRLGPIGIRKQKIKVTLNEDGTIDKRKLRPDWKATKDLWERSPEAKEKKQVVFHLNKHFDGYNCKWFWNKSLCVIPNQAVYSLTMTRDNKRKLAKAIFNEDANVDYYEIK